MCIILCGSLSQIVTISFHDYFFDVNDNNYYYLLLWIFYVFAWTYTVIFINDSEYFIIVSLIIVSDVLLYYWLTILSQ